MAICCTPAPAQPRRTAPALPVYQSTRYARAEAAALLQRASGKPACNAWPFTVFAKAV